MTPRLARCPTSSGSSVSRRSLSGAVLIAGMAAAILLYLVGGPPPPTPPSQVPHAAQAFDAKLRETAAGLHSRATTLADLPRLGAAVATDAATVQDLTQDELAFRLKPGETIEIGQVTKGGQALSLLRIPKGQTVSPPLDKPGVYLWPGPVLSEVVSIQPTVVTDIQRGALAVSLTVDPQKIVAELEALKVPARLEADGKVIAATRAAIAPGAKTASF